WRRRRMRAPTSGRRRGGAVVSVTYAVCSEPSPLTTANSIGQCVSYPTRLDDTQVSLRAGRRERDRGLAASSNIDAAQDIVGELASGIRFSPVDVGSLAR